MPTAVTTPRPDDRWRLTAGTSSAPDLFMLAKTPERRPPDDGETASRPDFDGAPGDDVSCCFRLARQVLSTRSGRPNLEEGS
jgi:hypothetical protein